MTPVRGRSMLPAMAALGLVAAGCKSRPRPVEVDLATGAAPAPAPTVLHDAGMTGGVHGIAVDADRVYFGLTTDISSVASIPKTGGAPTILARGGPIESLAVDEANVYFAVSDEGGRVAKVPKTGGAVTVLAPRERGAGQLVADGRRLYWTARLSSDRYARAIRSMPKEGGQVVTLVPETPSLHGVVLGPEHVYWTEPGPDHGRRIRRMPKQGGEPQTVAESDAPVLVAVAEDHLYFRTGNARDDGPLLRVPVEGGEPTPVVVVRGRPIGCAAIDGGALYLTTLASTPATPHVPLPPDASLLRTSPPAAATAIAHGFTECEQIVADGSGVYWTGRRVLLRAPR